jgi:molecular chaperone DnaK (HSP70)
VPVSIDFGTCNTVIARWRQGLQRAEIVRLDGLSRRFSHTVPGEPRPREAHVIPSLIHYGEGTDLLLGQQVNEAGLADHCATFRWLKLEMLRNSTHCRRVHGRVVSMREAATDLVRNSLAFALGQAHAENDLVLTVPVESFDRYVDWLQETVSGVFPGNVRTVDEATACILGYEQMVRQDQVYLVFDFGGGTLDVSIVRANLGGGDGQRAKILGRAGEEVGGGLIDQWMLEDLRGRGVIQEADIQAVGVPLLMAIETAKISLSSGEETADITQFNDRTGHMISCRITRADLSKLLHRHDLSALVSRTIQRALEMAQERYALRASQIDAVLMVGGSSLLLGVADLVKTVLPDTRVRCELPFEAIAAGACRYAGEDLNPTLVHEYAIRSWNRERKDYDWIPVIPRGTLYPTEKPVSGRYITTGVAESDVLGMVVWELSQMSFPQSVWAVGSDGQLRVLDQGERRVERERELNPQARELIHADPPCCAEELKRFVAAFGVDRHKRLTISLKDTRAGNASYVLAGNGEHVLLPIKDFPLVKL